MIVSGTSVDSKLSNYWEKQLRWYTSSGGATVDSTALALLFYVFKVYFYDGQTFFSFSLWCDRKHFTFLWLHQARHWLCSLAPPLLRTPATTIPLTFWRLEPSQEISFSSLPVVKPTFLWSMHVWITRGILCHVYCLLWPTRRLSLLFALGLLLAGKADKIQTMCAE